MTMTLRPLAMGIALVMGMTSAVQADDYAIDVKGAHASINFTANHLGFSFVTGRFDDFDGSFTFDPENPEASSVSVEIDTGSVNSNHEARDKHLRNDDFLNVDAHPKATFESTKVEVTGEKTAKITGDFTLNGVTNPLTLDVEYIGGGDDPWGNYRQGFVGTTSIDVSDYNFKKDYGNIDLTLHVEGIRK